MCMCVWMGVGMGGMGALCCNSDLCAWEGGGGHLNCCLCICGIPCRGFHTDNFGFSLNTTASISVLLRAISIVNAASAERQQAAGSSGDSIGRKRSPCPPLPSFMVPLSHVHAHFCHIFIPTVLLYFL